jgi:hypothetical protein
LNTKAVHPDFGAVLNETVTILEFNPVKTTNDVASGGWFDLANFKMPA